MDNRQAIKIIKTEKSWESDERIKTAFDLAIQALEKQIELEERIEHFKQCCHVNYDKTSIVGLLKKFLIN